MGLVLGLVLMIAMPRAAWAADSDSDSLPLDENGAYAYTLPGTLDYDASFEVLKLVNVERAAAGLAPLHMSKELLDAAMQRAAETSIYFSHSRPDGTRYFSVTAYASGENIAVNWSFGAADVMEMWMNSPGHRSNILTSRWTELGVGCFRQRDANGGVGGIYWVQLFGSRSSVTTDCAKPARKLNVSTTMQVRPEILLPTPEKAGYTFLGWYTAKTGGEKVTAETQLVGTSALYARWKALVYEITFNAAGGKVVGKAAASVKRSHDASMGRMPTPKKAGYSFQGWYTGKIKGVKVTNKTKVSKAVTFYAHWKLNVYTVKYNAAGGKVAGKASASVKRAYKSSLGKLPTPKKAGYSFQGWYTGKVKGVKMKATSKIARNVTLYAHWKKLR
jgi:uncharacterized repeat protein (TIGR02543 family)